MAATPPPAARPIDAARLALCQLPLDPAATPFDLFRRVGEVAADALAVDRVGVWLFTPDRQAIRCVSLFERSPREHSDGAVLRVTDVPSYFAALTERRVVTAAAGSEVPLQAELTRIYFTPLGIACTLDAAVYLNGEVTGVVCHESAAPREWTPAEHDFAAAVADQIALKLKQLEIRELESKLRLQPPDPPPGHDLLLQMAAGVGHDFKNLLTVILGQTGRLARRPDLPADARPPLAQIADAADRGAALAAELMTFGRFGREVVRVVRVGEAVERLLPVLRAAVGDGHSIEFVRTPGAGRSLLDPMQLERVLLNLVLNARDASPDGGPIRLGVGGETLPSNDGGPRQYARIEVADSGTGIPPDALPRIWEPFFTTKGRDRGTGLGLAVVKQIVERCGGFATVESTVGAGTTFRLYLPRVGGSMLYTIR
jgi:signal transduction histidine kinase